MTKPTMKAVGVLPGKRTVELVDHPIPRVQRKGEILFRTLEVGICGTDKEICSFVYGSPPDGFDYLILGHEALGEVVETGEGVTSLRPGDLVVPSVRRPCSDPNCTPCRTGLQDFCSSGGFTERGIKMTHGFLTEYVVEEERYLNRVPPNLRDVAVLVEPLTVAEKALAQVWKVQDRLPWRSATQAGTPLGTGKSAVVLGAGPVGILGAMLLLVHGFKTFVYSRSKTPNPKAEVVESLGATYVSALSEPADAFAQRVGGIDLVYEAVGVAPIAFEMLKHLGVNGVFVFTGIPAPKPGIDVEADLIMRNLVLQNQVVLGTVNADTEAFQNAVRDLEVFAKRWPRALRSLIQEKYPVSSYQELLTGPKAGIKNVISLD